MDLEKSVECKDLSLLMEVCKQKNIKPYFILMPVNGWFYDFMGLPKEKRIDFYDKIESNIKDNGFEALNMKELEYKPYYLTDIMHLGWKGWLYVDEKISRYINEN